MGLKPARGGPSKAGLSKGSQSVFMPVSSQVRFQNIKPDLNTMARSVSATWD